MIKLYRFSTFCVVFLFFQAIYAQFPMNSNSLFIDDGGYVDYYPNFITVFPSNLRNHYPCPTGYENPQTLTIHDSNDNSVATFSGGMRMGEFAYFPCRSSDSANYATMKRLKYGSPTNLLNTITVTFPNPVWFTDISFHGKPNQEIKVTLDDTATASFHLTLQEPYRAFFWHDFPGAELPQRISTIKVESLSPDWNFEVSSVSYINPAILGTGGPAPAPTPGTPLVFVPGIAGSKLRLNPGTPNSEIRWIPHNIYTSLSDPLGLSVLALNSNGESVNNIDVPGVARDEPKPVGENDHTYQELLDNTLLVRAKYTEYEISNNPYYRTLGGCLTNQTPRPTLFVFAYDWRKSNTQNTAALKEYIDCVRLIYHDVDPDQKVDMVAHSMGGLLSRRYILDYPSDNHVSKLITVNSPFLGAPRAIHVMETGSFLSGAFDSENGGDEIPSFISAKVMRVLANNFRGAHELLPSYNYFRLASMNPFSIDDRPQSYGQTRDWMNARHTNTRPADNTANFHDYVNADGNKQEDWSGDTTGVQYFHIYGKQRTNRTVGSVRMENYTLCRTDEIDCIGLPLLGQIYYIGTRFRPIPAEGDGTVALASAKRIGNGFDLNYRQNSAENPFRFIIKPSGSESDTAADHNESLKNRRVLNEIVTLLKGESNHNLSVDTENSFAKTAEPQEPSFFVTASNIEGFHFGDGPLPAGAFVATSGLNSTGETVAIPIGEKCAWFATPAYAQEVITFKNDGTPMEIEVVKGVDYETATEYVKYSNLVLPANVAIELRISPNGIEDVHYDNDGDGYPETLISPSVHITGSLAKDITQPVLSYNFQQQGSQQLLTLSATDSESGLRQIRYSTDGQHFYPYSNPVSINYGQFQKVYAFAEDNNRNKTGISTINVPLSPTAAEVSVSGRVFSRQNRGVGRASVMIISTNGNFSKTVRTNQFGYFNFTDVPAGNDYIISVIHKLFTFNSQVLSLNDNVDDLVFTAN
jgi:pimeloyl-ACP methyl ester carboxylesterase